MPTVARDHERLRDAFVRALDMPTDERGAFAHRVFHDRADLARRLESLLGDADDVSTGHAYDDDVAATHLLYTEPLLAHDRLGDYRVLGLVGRGGMAVVLHAEHVPTRREVALKILPLGTASITLRDRLEREGAILRRLRHENLARWRDSGMLDTPEGPRPFLAMDYFPGVPLLQWVRAEDPARDRRLRVLEQVARAVAYAHAHDVVHRDLKPGNVLVDEDDRVCVLDFGVAKVLAESGTLDPTLTRDGQLVGTLRYMSPEQARGDLDAIGPTTDVHALGLLIFEVMTGVLPYAVPSTVTEALPAIVNARPRQARAVVSDLPRGIDLVCEGALERDVRERTPSADLVAMDLRAVREGRRVPRRRGRWRRFARRAVRPALAVAALLAFAAGGLALGLDRGVDPDVAMQLARTELARANTLIHDNQRTEANLEQAIEWLDSARDHLDRAGDRPDLEEWRRFLHWRSGEAHHFLGAMRRDVDSHARAWGAWRLANRIDHERTGLEFLDPNEGLSTDIAYITVVRTYQGTGLALASMAAYEDPRRLWRASLSQRTKAFQELARVRGVDSWTELPLRRRDQDHGYVRNEYAESLSMMGGILPDRRMLDKAIAMLQETLAHGLLERDMYANASCQFNLGRAFALRAETFEQPADADSAEVWLERSLETRSASRSIGPHVTSHIWLLRAHRLHASFAERDTEAFRVLADAMDVGDRMLADLGSRMHPLDRGRLERELGAVATEATRRRMPGASERAGAYFEAAGTRIEANGYPVDFTELQVHRARLECVRAKVENDPAAPARARAYLDAATSRIGRTQLPWLFAQIDVERTHVGGSGN